MVREAHWPADEGPELRDLTVGGLLDEAAARWPDREAIVYTGYEEIGLSTHWTFAELAERSLAVARAFEAAGIQRGERVAVWATNKPEWLLLQFGSAYAGVILVPMNPLYRSTEITHVLGKSGAVACFLEPENRGVDLIALLDSVAGDLPQLQLRVSIGDSGGRAQPMEEWIAAGASVPDERLAERRAAVEPGDTAMILFTSGTTGFSKGAELTHLGVVNNALYFAVRGEMIDGGRHCNPMPFFHCGGCVQATLGPLITGTTQLPTLTFDAERIVRMIESENVTSVSAVPTMIIALEEAANRVGASFESLQLVVTGASPIPVDVLRRWRSRFGVRFTVTYGLTEASPTITQSPPGAADRLQIETCGTPLPHFEVDIVDPETGKRVQLGEQGELRARGPMIMKGYWDEPGATAATVKDGWLHSGDLATMDEQGYISITGRAKDMIIRGGENIDPAEIENALRQVDSVVEASVVGLADERYGETVAAFVRGTEGATVSPDAIRTELRGAIARFKIPDRIFVVDRFPLTPSGKIQKYKLREWLAQNADAIAEGTTQHVAD